MNIPESSKRWVMDLSTHEMAPLPEFEPGTLITSDPAAWDHGMIYLPRFRVIWYAPTEESARAAIEEFLEGSWRPAPSASGSLVINL